MKTWQPHPSSKNTTTIGGRRGVPARGDGLLEKLSLSPADSAAEGKGPRWDRKGASPRKPGAGRAPRPKTLINWQSPGAAGVASLPRPVRSGRGAARGRWAPCAGVETEARGGGEPAGDSAVRGLGCHRPPTGSARWRPSSSSETPFFLWKLSHSFIPREAPSSLCSPSFPIRAGMRTAGGEGGVGRASGSAAGGGQAAGFPAGKQPPPAPGLSETLNPSRRQNAPAGKRPQPGFPSRVGPP